MEKVYTKNLKLISLSLVLISSLTFAKTVPNLGSVEKSITYSEGNKFFDEQMKGLPQSKEFGTLPEGLNASEFIKWIAPNEPPSLLTLTGAKPWGTENLFIGIACFAGNKSDANSAISDKETACVRSRDDFSVNNLYLSVFKWQDNKFTPIAKTDNALDIGVSWHNSSLTAPTQDFDGENDEPILPETYKNLDLAPYQINDKTKAFGVRVWFSEGYSGGGASFEALQLFMIKDKQIINILSEPMYFYQDLAGDWNDDGTRNHEINEGKNILRILKTKTNGYYDVQIKSLDYKWEQTFKWSNNNSSYMPKGK